MENHRVDDIFKSAFEKLQPEVQTNNWKAISTHLNRTKRSTAPRMRLIYASISIAAGILVFFGLEFLRINTDLKELSVNVKRSNQKLTRVRQNMELPKTEFSPNAPIYSSLLAKRERNKKQTFVHKNPKINTYPVIARIGDAVSVRDSNRATSPNLNVLNIKQVKTARNAHLDSPGVIHLDSYEGTHSVLYGGTQLNLSGVTHLDSSVNTKSPLNNRTLKISKGETSHFLNAFNSIKMIGQKIKKNTAHVVRMKQDSDGKEEYILNLGIARIVKVSNPQD